MPKIKGKCFFFIYPVNKLKTLHAYFELVCNDIIVTQVYSVGQIEVCDLPLGVAGGT